MMSRRSDRTESLVELALLILGKVVALAAFACDRRRSRHTGVYLGLYRIADFIDRLTHRLDLTSACVTFFVAPRTAPSIARTLPGPRYRSPWFSPSPLGISQPVSLMFSTASVAHLSRSRRYVEEAVERPSYIPSSGGGECAS